MLYVQLQYNIDKSSSTKLDVLRSSRLLYETTKPNLPPVAGPEKCCNGQFCCEEEYFLQLKSLPCINHASCRDLGYGQLIYTLHLYYSFVRD
jgi:hypothetical protein